MITLTTLDRTSATPLYMQLYESIKKMIIEKELAAGEMLPSKRALASQLGLSLKTIENAYGQLDLEGYIFSKEKKGYYVSRMDTYVTATQPKQRYICKPDERKYDMDLSVTDDTGSQFPISAWSRLMREVIADEGEKLLDSGSAFGHPRLRAAIASYLEQFRGMSVSPDQIVVGAGTEYLYARLFRLLGGNCVFGLEDPGSAKTRSFYQFYGIPYRSIPVDEEGISMEALRRSNCNIVHMSPSHHYPLGYVTGISRRVELLFWVNEKPNRYIVENEYDSEFRYVGMPVPTIHSIDIRDKVIFISSFNRYVGNAVKVSYMVLPKKLMERYVEMDTFYTCPLSAFDQILLAKFIEEGGLERQLNHLKHYYSVRREQILQILKGSTISKRCEIIEYASGTHFILKLDTRVSDEHLKQYLAEHRIRASFVSEYCEIPDSKYKHMLLVNYSGVSDEQFINFLELLQKGGA